MTTATSADVDALSLFVETSGRQRVELAQQRDELVALRNQVVACSPHSPAPASCLDVFADLLDHWNRTESEVVAVRTGLMAADSPFLLAGDGISLFSNMRPSLAERAMADAAARLVTLGAERQDLLVVARSESAAALGAQRRLDEIEAEIDGLAQNLDRRGWQQVALGEAGIDPEAWDPSKGLLHNDETVRAVYEYYGQLYLEDPRLQWAGLASLVGRQLYAGWQDLYVVRHLTDEGQRLAYMSELMGIPTGPDLLYDVIDVVADAVPLDPLGPIEALTANDLEWLEVKMLDMQKEIFNDLGWQHAAYRYGGIEALEATLVDPTDRRVLDAWVQIDSGDPEEISAGTNLLAVREQRDLIQDDWNDIRDHHGLVGEAITSFLTFAAKNPVPGGRSYGESMNTQIKIPYPAPFVLAGWLPFFPNRTITLQVPVGNVADYDDRWQWFETEIQPAFEQFAHEHPEQLATILKRPLTDDAEEQRLLPLLPYPGGH